MLMTAQSTKMCKKCNTEKEVSEFYYQARGYTSWCKSCLREYSKQRVADGRDKVSKIKSELKKGHDRNNLKPRIAHNKGKRTVTDTHKMVKNMYRNLKKRSLFMNIELTVSFEQVEELINDFCMSNYHVISSNKHPFKPSIDRIDPSKGYTLDNTRICWLIENLCKNSFTEDAVIEFCKRKLGLMIDHREPNRKD